MKKIFTITILALVFLAPCNTVVGQANTVSSGRFDWVKSYTGTDRQNKIDNYIVGSVTDSDGNVYILGQCAFNATFEGVSISPIQYSNRNSIVIAKISPSGDMVWHKTVATKGSNGACAIRMNGDTSLICMLGLSLADTIYFLDTLYTDARSEIMPSDSLDSRNGTVFVTLSLDGELQEFHLLQTVYVDYAGHQITTDKITGNAADSSTVSPHGFSDCTFVVDNNGNIIARKNFRDTELVMGKESRYNDLSVSFTADEIEGTPVQADVRRIIRVSFDVNGGTGDVADVTTDLNGHIAIPDSTPTAPVSNPPVFFRGWYTARTGGELVTEQTFFGDPLRQ